MSFSVRQALADQNLTHGEQVNLIVQSRNRYAQTHGDASAAATTDRTKLVSAVAEQLKAEGANDSQASAVAERVVDAWLNSSSMKGSQGTNQTLTFSASDIAFPVMAPAAPPRRAGGSGTPVAGPGALRAEDAVARRQNDRTRAWSMDEITANPSRFARLCPQIDGNRRTDADRAACGPAAFTQGMIRARPEAIRDMATKLLAADGSLTADGRRLFSGLDTQQGREALGRIKSGSFSPADVHTVIMGMYNTVSSGTAGTTADNLISLRGRLTALGVSVPRIEMERFGPEAGGGIGHWRSVVGSEQFDPWPNARGESEVISDGSGLARGVQDGPGWVNTEKVFLDDRQAVLNQYNLQVDGSPTTTASDPPLIVAGYRLNEGNSRFERNSLNVEGLISRLPADKQRFAHPAAKDNIAEGVSVP